MRNLAPLVVLAAMLSFSSRAVAAEWGPETPLTSTGSSVYGEGIAAAGSTLHMIYGTSTISYRRSLDEGGSWSPPMLLGNGTIHLTDPIIADGNDVWVVYLANQQNVSDWCCSRDLGSIWLLRSRNGGTSWDPPKQLTTPSGAYRVSLAYAANRLHLVWMDYRSNAWDTYHLRSSDRGDTWEPEVVIAKSTGVFGAERPQVAARGDSVHVTIWDDRGSNPSCKPGTYTFPKCPDVFHVRSIDGGKTWKPITNVANGGAFFAGRNDIAVAGTANVIINYNVDVANETGSKLFAIASPDDGVTWNPPIRLTTSANASDHGSIIGAGRLAFLVWHDDRNPANREVYYRHTLDAGMSWEAEEQVSSGALGDSSTPLDAVTPGYAHVIWIDDRSGSYQVYYRRRTLPLVPAVDAGVPEGGAPDATTPPDGGVPATDAGVGDGSGGDGCSCHVARGSTNAWPWPGVIVVALLALLRRRANRN
jgi:MYXO-CTERM domain-containing protein